MLEPTNFNHLRSVREKKPRVLHRTSTTISSIWIWAVRSPASQRRRGRESISALLTSSTQQPVRDRPTGLPRPAVANETPHSPAASSAAQPSAQSMPITLKIMKGESRWVPLERVSWIVDATISPTHLSQSARLP